MVCIRSAVRVWSWVREVSEEVVGRGNDSERPMRRGSRSSTNSSSGGKVSGENSGYERDCSRRVWWCKCVDSAEWAVLNLLSVNW